MKQKLFSVVLLLAACGCSGLQVWDRIGAGFRLKTVGWLENIAGLEIELWIGAERVLRKEEVKDDLPDWFKESWLRRKFSFDDLSNDDGLCSP